MDRRLFLSLCAGIAVVPKVLQSKDALVDIRGSFRRVYRTDTGEYIATLPPLSDLPGRSLADETMVNDLLRLARSNVDNGHLFPWVPNRARNAYRA